MEYKTTARFDETYFEECLAMWKFSSKGAYDNVRTFSICSILYLFIGLIDYLQKKPISLFVSTLGLACVILLVLQIINIYTLKARTKKSLLAQITKYKNDPTSLRELHFTEEAIKYFDPEILMEVKWSAISHYLPYGNYIYFFCNGNKKPTLSLDKRNIPDAIEKELLLLISSKTSLRI